MSGKGSGFTSPLTIRLLKAEKGDDPPFGGWLLTAEWRVQAFEGDLLLLEKQQQKQQQIPRSPLWLKGQSQSLSRSPLTAPRYTSPMQTIEFQLEREHVELNQLLKLVGLCDSGGAGKAIVASGEVLVDGQVELRKTCKIHAGQTVVLDDVEIKVVAAG